MLYILLWGKLLVPKLGTVTEHLTNLTFLKPSIDVNERDNINVKAHIWLFIKAFAILRFIFFMFFCLTLYLT